MITTTQAIILAFLVFFSKSAFTPNLTYDWFKPLPASFFVGLVTGDMQTAVSAGISIQLVYMGYMMIGSVAPQDLAVAGIIGSALAVSLRTTMPLEAAVASGLGIAVAVATPATALQNLSRTIYTFTNEKSLAFARLGNLKMQRLWYWVPAQILTFLIYFPITLIVLLAIGNASFLDTLTKFLNPISVHLSVVGKLLPAVGIALALRTITTKHTIPFLLIGFVLSSYLGLPILAIVIIGAMVAYLIAFDNKNNSSNGNDLQTIDDVA